MTCQTICDSLNDEGKPNRSGMKFGISTLQVIIDNKLLYQGTIIVIRVKIDDLPHFDIGDNSTKSLKVTEGVHTVSYEQLNGIGRKNNRGQVSVTVADKKSITFSSSRQGLLVK